METSLPNCERKQAHAQHEGGGAGGRVGARDEERCESIAQDGLSEEDLQHGRDGIVDPRWPCGRVTV